MKTSEKITTAVLLVVLIIAFSIYGVWEDKMTFLSLLIPLLYLALALWAVGGMTHGAWGKASSGREQNSSFIFHFSSFSIPPGGGMLLLFWLYSAALIPFSVIPYEAKISTLRFGCYLGTYWAVANICSCFSRRKTVWTVLLMALLMVALYSLVQHHIAPERVLWAQRYITRDVTRLGGTYICSNHIAHLFQLWIPFCVVFLFIPQFGWFWRICFGYALPVFGLLIYRTQSRAGLLGTVASIGMLLLLLMLRKSRRAFLISLLAVPLLVFVAVGGLWFGSSMFRERMQPVADVAVSCFAGDWEKAVSIDFRPQTWTDSLQMIKERPLTGVGPGNYGQTFPEYRQRVLSNRIETVHPHNEPIELITEYGLIGTILFGWALASICVALVRLIKTSDRSYHALPAAALLAALAGTLVHGLFDFELRIFPNALMLAVLAGCAVAPVMRKRSEIGDQSSAGMDLSSDLRPPMSFLHPLTSVLRPLISILLLLAAVWAVQVMSSALLRVHGDRLRLADQRPRAETLYKVATAIDPQNWNAYLGLGQIYSYTRYKELDPAEKQNLANRERDIFAKAYRYNTKKEEVVYGLGRAELAAGNREVGLDRLRQAAHYKRFNDFYWRKLGIELRKVGHYEEALETFLYAQKLDRTNKTVKRNIEWLGERMSDVGDQRSAQ